MTTYYSHLLTIFLLVATVAGPFHHHLDGTAHHDCSICIAAHQQAEPVHLTPEVPCRTTVVARTIFPCTAVVVPANTFFAPARSRTPPA